MRDRNGKLVVFHVYDRARRAADGWGYWRVAVFASPEAADAFLADKPASYFVSRDRPTRSDLSFVRDPENLEQTS